MSRLLWTAVLVLSLGLSLAAQAPKSAAPAKAGASTPVAGALEAKIRQAWQDFKDKKKQAYAAVLADDDTQVWADGKPVRDKATAVKDVDTVTLTSYSLTNFKTTPLGSDAALVTYLVKVAGTASGQKIDGNLAVTEVWVKRGADWKELRYHESEIK